MSLEIVLSTRKMRQDVVHIPIKGFFIVRRNMWETEADIFTGRMTTKLEPEGKKLKRMKIVGTKSYSTYQRPVSSSGLLKCGRGSNRIHITDSLRNLRLS